MVVKERREDPQVFIEGIDEVIKLDLAKHKELLRQTKGDLDAYVEAANHESKRKRYYYRLIGKGKFDDDSLRQSVKDIRINIRHLTDKVDAAKEKMRHHQLIIDTLTKQLQEYNTVAATVKRQLNGNAPSD